MESSQHFDENLRPISFGSNVLEIIHYLGSFLELSYVVLQDSCKKG